MLTIQATYKNGSFLPQEPIELPEGIQVTLKIEPGDTILPHLRPQDREFLDRLVIERAEVFRRLAE